LLANIYLHEFDRWWWEKYGKLTHLEKAKRREAGIGNCILTRYADDFVLLCNGPHAEAERLRKKPAKYCGIRSGWNYHWRKPMSRMSPMV